MLRRRRINSGPRGRIARSLSPALDAAKWPFERLAWAAERRLLWPLRERAAGFGPSPQLAGAAALVAVAVAAVAGGLLLSGGHGATRTERVASTADLTAGAAVRQPSQATSGPALHGAAPSFDVAPAAGAGGTAAGDSGAPAGAPPAESPGEAESGAAAATGVGATGEAGAATASSAEPVPAGPEAMKVAGRFAHAFVFYEIGKRPARVKTVFGQTATADLVKALEERPPRLPERAEVPRAKVVNLVPGPRHGKDYTVSVSLLRVGLTSELRITLRADKSAGWKVSEILG